MNRAPAPLARPRPRGTRCTTACAASASGPAPSRKTISLVLARRAIQTEPESRHKDQAPRPTRPEKVHSQPWQPDLCNLPLRPINSVRSPVMLRAGIIHIKKCRPSRKFIVVRIAGKHDAGRLRRFRSRHASCSFSGKSPNTHSTYPVAESLRGRPDSLRTFSTANFTGASSRDINPQLGTDARFAVLKYAVAESMPCNIRGRASLRQGVRRPEIAVFFVTQDNKLLRS